MKRIFVSAAVLSGLVAGQAGALTPTTCFSNGTLNACASVAISLVSGNTYKATVTNLGGNTTYTLSGFGFYAYGDQGKLLSLIPYNANSPSTTSPSNWADLPPVGTVKGGSPQSGCNLNPQRCLNIAGLDGYYFFGFAEGGVQAGLADGQSADFFFNLTGNWPSQYEWGWRGQEWDGPGFTGQSIKCFPGADASNGYLCGPPTVVPEPATMALLATGLVGVAGAGLVRRRRQQG